MFENINKEIEDIEIKTTAFINGNYHKSSSNEYVSKASSIDGRKLPSLDACDEHDIDLAVSIANETYRSKVWVNTPAEKKKKIILRLAELVELNRKELAILDTIETGRSIKNYYYDSIPKAIESMCWFAESIDKIYDISIPSDSKSYGTIIREPLGVVGIITPWNDPLVVAFWKLTPALLMGNSVVLKPAENSSYSILKVASLAIEAGIPAGVFNVVPGYGNVAGKALSLHNDVRGVFFTGSSAVGKMILQYSGLSNMKKVGLECGGKSPFIVSKNCKDLLLASEVLAKNIFYNQGQICSAPSRLIIHKNLKNKFINMLYEESEKYKPSSPLDINSEVGAVVSKGQKEKINTFIEDGKKNGFGIHTFNEEVPHLNGEYIFPTIFENVDEDSTLLKDEIFGPVLVVEEFEEMADAINKANNTRYGLAASIWSNDLDEVHYVSRSLEAGIVHVNSYGDDNNLAPFGGIKESGIGKDKSLLAFDEYSYLKTIWMKFQ